MDDTPTQQCGSCKQQLPHSAFSPSYIGKRGTWCRDCFSAAKRGEPVKASYLARPCSVCGADYVPKQIKAKSLNCCPKCKKKALTRRRKELGTYSEINRRHNIKKLYGITPEQYDELLTAQSGVCAICRNGCGTYPNLSVDHDHRTGVIRGLLCNVCNRFMGMAGDDPDLLRAAADYLQRHTARQSPL